MDLLEQMRGSMKKHAGEQRSLGRGVGGGKISVEEAEAYLSRNAEVFAQLGYRKKERRRSHSESDVSSPRDKNPKGRDGNPLLVISADRKIISNQTARPIKSILRNSKKRRGMHGLRGEVTARIKVLRKKRKGGRN